MQDCQICKCSSDLADKITNWRRDFHRYPESGWTEFRTSAKIAAELTALGYHVRLGEEILQRQSMMGVPSEKDLSRHMARALEEGADPLFVMNMQGGMTGVVADLRCGKGPVFALRFDIDANDITEAADENHQPFAAQFSSLHPGVMHACGHDGHIAMGLGVAHLLAGLQEQIAGTVRLIFQPAEEGVRGAAPMVAAGILSDVDYILAGHIGFLALRNRQLICAVDTFLATTKFDVRFTGISAHAGKAPEEGRNALLAASCAALNLHAIPRHGKGVSHICVGRLVAGEGRNIIPANALLKVETRGETSEIDISMFSHAQHIIEGAAHMYGVDYDITLMGQAGSGASSPLLGERLAAMARRMDYFAVDDIQERMSMGGSEDFSLMMSFVQQHGGMGCYFSLGTKLAAGHHNPYFDFDESCMVPGAELLASLVFNCLGERDGAQEGDWGV